MSALLAICHREISKSLYNLNFHSTRVSFFTIENSSQPCIPKHEIWPWDAFLKEMFTFSRVALVLGCECSHQNNTTFQFSHLSADGVSKRATNFQLPTSLGNVRWTMSIFSVLKNREGQMSHTSNENNGYNLGIYVLLQIPSIFRSYSLEDGDTSQNISLKISKTSFSCSCSLIFLPTLFWKTSNVIHYSCHTFCNSSTYYFQIPCLNNCSCVNVTFVLIL